MPIPSLRACSITCHPSTPGSNNEKAIAKKAGFIALTDRQLKKARYQYLQALKANNT